MTLVDKDRLCIKSGVGMGVGMAAGSESSRDEAFCAHTILEHKGIVVNDMLTTNALPIIRWSSRQKFVFTSA